MRHEDDGAADTARRGGPCMRHEDEWTYAAECAQQGAYGSRGCPAGRLPAARRATCLIWVAELPAAPRHHNGDCIVGRAPSGRAPAKRPPARSALSLVARPPGAVICALSTHMCSDVLSASSVARAVFMAVFLLLRPPDTCPAMIWRWKRGPRHLYLNASTHLICRVLSDRSTTNLASRFTGPPQTMGR